MTETSPASRSQVTRQDRAVLDPAWMRAFLQRTGMAVLATSHEGQPFQATLLFVYDPKQHAVYLHTARRGRIWENVQAGGAVGLPACLTAAAMGRLLPAETALNFSVEYEAVVLFGTLRLVEDPHEAETALQRLLDKYFPHLHPGQDYRAITAAERDVTAVYRLEVEEWSGKRKAVDADFPGAFEW